MKNINFIIIALLVSVSNLVFGQINDLDEFKIKLNSGKLIVREVNKVDFEGYKGDEIVITTTGRSSSKSERAKGLKIINGSGYDDNTGLGLSMLKSGNEVKLNQVSRKSGSRRYKILVPEKVTISYEHSTHEGSKVYFKNISGEIEVNTNHNSVNLENVTGPLTISTVHGKIEADFKSVTQDNPISIASVHGLVDIAIPANTKAELRMSSNWGEIYSDFDIDIKSGREGTNYRKYSSDIQGSINGGGVRITIESTHSNIYLRQKK